METSRLGRILAAFVGCLILVGCVAGAIVSATHKDWAAVLVWIFISIFVGFGIRACLLYFKPTKQR